MLIWLSAFLPVAVWVLLRLSQPYGPYEFDHGLIPGTFNVLFLQYSRLFYTIILLALLGGGIAWRIDAHWLIPGFVLAAFDALIFIGLMILFYEGYCAARYPRSGPMAPSNYTINRYALVQALGWSAAILLILSSAGLVQELLK